MGSSKADDSDDAISEAGFEARTHRRTRVSTLPIEPMPELDTNNHQTQNDDLEDTFQDPKCGPQPDEEDLEERLPIEGTLDNFEYLDAEDESDVESDLSEDEIINAFQESYGDEWEDAYERFCECSLAF
jgi:hypothetical protein